MLNMYHMRACTKTLTDWAREYGRGMETLAQERNKEKAACQA
jgi:transposase-like protein